MYDAEVDEMLKRIALDELESRAESFPREEGKLAQNGRKKLGSLIPASCQVRIRCTIQNVASQH